MVGKDGSGASAFCVARMHGESVFLGGGIDDNLDVFGRADHSGEGSFEIVKVGLVGTAASATVVGSSVAHGDGYNFGQIMMKSSGCCVGRL